MLERIRARSDRTPIVVDGHELTVTVSLGGATRDDESADALIARADNALYAAKKQGRDRVAMAAGRE